MYVSMYVSSYLSIYLSFFLSIYLSLSLCVYVSTTHVYKSAQIPLSNLCAHPDGWNQTRWWCIFISFAPSVCETWRAGRIGTPAEAIKKIANNLFHANTGASGRIIQKHQYLAVSLASCLVQCMELATSSTSSFSTYMPLHANWR